MRLQETTIAVMAVASVLSAAGEPSEMCYEAVDVVQVQDMTSSFDFVWPEMSKQVGNVVNYIYEINPNSRFGFSTFGDKPLRNPENPELGTGYLSDYCFKVDIPLSQPRAAEMQEVFADYSRKAAGGGGDWPEDVLGGMYRAMISKQVGWRDIEGNTFDLVSDDDAITVNHTRVVVVVTDAVAHLPGDVKEVTTLDVRPFDVTAEAIAASDDVNLDCAVVDYPDVKIVADEIKRQNAVAIVLAAPGGKIDEETGAFSPYASIANKGPKYRNKDGLALWYQDLFTAEGVDVFVSLLDNKMTVYYDAFKDAMDKFQSWRCGHTTTPEPETTTTPEPIEPSVTETDPQGITTTVPTPVPVTTASEPEETTAVPTPVITTAPPTTTEPIEPNTMETDEPQGLTTDINTAIPPTTTAITTAVLTQPPQELTTLAESTTPAEDITTTLPLCPTDEPTEETTPATGEGCECPGCPCAPEINVEVNIVIGCGAGNSTDCASEELNLDGTDGHKVSLYPTAQ